jgi:amidase
MEAAIDVLKKSGAEVVDPTDIESLSGLGNAELEVLLHELKADLNAYLATLGPAAPVKTLKDIIDFNERNADKELIYFGQELFIQAEAKGPLTDSKYLAALKKSKQLAADQGLDAVMTKNRLDAIVAPTNGPAWTTDHVNGDHFVGGSSTGPAIVGVSFSGRAWSEPTLIKIAFAFEQATKHRQAPKFLATLDAT